MSNDSIQVCINGHRSEDIGFGVQTEAALELQRLEDAELMLKYLLRIGACRAYLRVFLERPVMDSIVPPLNAKLRLRLQNEIDL